MIFGNEYDKSLYLILRNDKKNRDAIVDFLKLMPVDFLEKIKNCLKEYENYNDIKYITSEMCTKDGYLYSFNFDIKNLVLSISKSVYQYGAYYKEFEIRLNRCFNIGKYNKFSIGSISYGFNNNVNLSNSDRYKLREFKYDVLTVPFNNLLFVFENNMLIGTECLSVDRLNSKVDLIEEKLINSKKRCLRKD